MTAYQLFFEWTHGLGFAARDFDECSVMGSQMMRADYVEEAVYLAAAANREQPVSRSLSKEYPGWVQPWAYALYDFPSDVLGANPARGFHGSIEGSAVPAAPINTSIGTIVPVTVTMKDDMTAVSGTRASGAVGGYKIANPLAVFTAENPYGANGPMRTITVNYNLKLCVVYPAIGGSPFIMPQGCIPKL